MHSSRIRYLYLAHLVGCCLAASSWASHAFAVQTSAFSTDQRIQWNESRIQGSPEPPDPYDLEVAFPGLHFNSPIDLVPVPGTNRLAIAEQHNGISTFTVDSKVDKANLTLSTADKGFEIYSIAFHPRFQQNGMVFFTHGNSDGMHLARVHCRTTDVPVADADSLAIVFSWPPGGHTGGCIRFGPDGYLYLATGDGSGHSDTNLYAQNINDPRGSILRLDVDHPLADRLYGVPADNPFVDRPNAMPEMFAYGLRQPWKFSFDRKGNLWAGEVGQDLWEMVHLIRNGGNYGWSIMEGTHPFRPERIQGPTAIVPPVVEHHHTEFRSVTGGHEYYGSRLPELQDAYIYGDFDTGRIWMLRYDGSAVTEHKPLNSSPVRIVAFGQDHEGEVYIVGYASGRIYRLRRSTVSREDLPEFPRKLSQTGLFSSTMEHRLAAGVIPFSINAPSFADGAIVERYLGLPGESQIEFDALLYPYGPGAPPGWRFPDGSVLVQTFSMPDTQLADGIGRRRIETRILQHTRMPGVDDSYGAQIWNGYTYIWNDDQTDAELAATDGAEVKLVRVDPVTGQQQSQTWRVPSRGDCTACHNIASKHVVGMNTLQLNREHDYGDKTENQLRVFERLGLFKEPLPAATEVLPRLVDYRQASAGLDQRARAYLHANCSHCHRQWGGGNSSFQLMVTLPTDELNILNTLPAHGDFGVTQARLIAPGRPYQSTLLLRMLSLGAARMPRLGSSLVDEAGAMLIHDWIASLPADESLPTDPGLPPELFMPFDSGTDQVISDWLSDASRSMQLIHAIDSRQLESAVRERILARAAQSIEAHVRDLFDRYQPEEKRTKRLGHDIDPGAILSLSSDAGRGESLFFQSTTLQCKSCHQVKGQGTPLGPDLTHIGKEYNSYRLLDSITNPSHEVKPEFQTYVVATSDGRIVSGLRTPNTGDDVVIRDANNRETRIAAADVEQIVPQERSMMPDAQVASMTAQELADLIAFLSSLK